MTAPARPRLWMVRHAQPLVEDGLCYGQLDMPADATATRLAAAGLVQAHPATWAAIFHSPLQRCELLAQQLQVLMPDMALRPNARLAEIAFGQWEGQPWNAIDRAALDAWTQDFCHYRPGEGESLAQMLHRVAAALQSAQAIAEQQGRDVLWITHAGVVRCVLWLLQHGERLPQAQDWVAPAPGYGAWTSVELPTPGRPNVTTRNR